MTLAFEEIREDYEAGLTPQQILDKLHASPLYKNDIIAVSIDPYETDLFDVLDAYGLMQADDFAAAIQAQNNPELTAAYERLMRQTMTVSRVIRCSAYPQIAQLVTVFTSIAKQIRPQYAADISKDMLTLTGGPKYADVTLEDVQLVILQHERSQRRTEISPLLTELQDFVVLQTEKYIQQNDAQAKQVLLDLKNVKDQATAGEGSI